MNTRTDKLLKENKASLIRNQWLAGLSQATGIPTSALTLVDVDTTSTLKKEFFQKIKSGKGDLHRYWPKEKIADIADFLLPLSRILGTRQVILFSSVDQYIGAVQLSLGTVLQNLAGVWKAVGEDLSMTMNAGHDGLCLEENYYDSDGNYLKEGVYELTAWGLLVP